MSEAQSLRARVFGYVVGFGLVAASIVPAAAGLRDSFPFSTYPMFSTKRDNPTVHVAVGIDADGGEIRLGPKTVVGTHEVMQAAQTIQKAMRAGKEARRSLCETIASRVASDDDLAAIERIELRSLRYDPVAYFETDPPVPLDERVRVRCKVPRKVRGS